MNNHKFKELIFVLKFFNSKKNLNKIFIHMFIQKLDLNPKKSYSTTADIENIVENLHVTYNHVPIISPYVSKSLDINEIENKLKNDKSSIKISVPLYFKYKEKFDSSHIIIENFAVMESFGYSVNDLDKPVIVNENISEFERIKLCKFFIKAESSERFVVLFILAQMFKPAIITKDVERTEIFCKVFKLNCKVYDFNDENTKIEEECVIFMSCYKEVECERIFLIGRKSLGLQRLEIDVNEAGKFKYRINDVVSELFSFGFRRLGKFNYERYENIHK